MLDFGRSFSIAPYWTYEKTQTTLATFRVDHDFGGGWKADATLGVGKESLQANQLGFGGSNIDREIGLITNSYFWKADTDQRRIALSARLSGPVYLAGREHQLNFGYQGQRKWGRQDYYTFDGDAPAIGSIYDWNGSIAEPDWYLAQSTDWAVQTTQHAIFGAGKFSFSDSLNLIVGARYSDWTAGERNFKQVIPYAGLTWDLNDNFSLYASYTEIFNPQDARDRNGQYLDPVLGKSEEIGAKAEFYGGRLNASLSFYRTYQDNVATADIGQIVPETGGQAYYGVKGVEAKGVEFELSGEIRDGWNLSFSASKNRVRDASGNEAFQWRPEHTVRLFTAYNLPNEYSAWTIGGGLRWQSATSFPSLGATQSSYAVVDVMATFSKATAHEFLQTPRPPLRQDTRPRDSLSESSPGLG